MEVYFIRHAEKQKDVENPSLTERGEKQAKHLADSLKGIKFTHFYRSDTNRTNETSKFVSEVIGMEPEVIPSLNEYSARLLKAGREEWKPEEAERYDELVEFIKSLSKDVSEEKKILILGHGVTNRLIMAALLELDLKNIIRMAQLDTAVNIAYWVERFGNWRLRSWNDINHLPEDLKENLDGY